jgi:photosystem II stability/assembly factor-like uncharacterized protein
LRRDSGVRETMLVAVIAVIAVPAVIVGTRATIRETRDMKNVRKDKPITLEMKERGERNQLIGSKSKIETRGEGHSHNHSHRNTKNLRGVKKKRKIIGSLKEIMRGSKREE